MKVFALASLAALSQALKIREDYWDCYGEWIWEECSGFYYQDTLCDVEDENDGWWYSPDADEDGTDDFFVTADEWDTWEECSDEWAADNWCENDWNETDLGNWWRHPCDGEAPPECGWVYWGDEAAGESDYWWSCEEHEDWIAGY